MINNFPIVLHQTSNITYEWRSTPGWKWVGDAEEIGRHIETIAEDKDGFLTTKDIVNDARTINSPLHPNFEWDDLVAAEKYRDVTARNLIGSLVAVQVKHEEDGKEPTEIRVRAFVNVQVDGESRYSPISVIVRRTDLYDQYMTQLWQEMVNWKKKAEKFQEFALVVNAIDQLSTINPQPKLN